jgi:hypothetical protein
MRLPSAPDAPDFEETGPIRVATGARDPSYPDRARIDSDVRYLLRPPSTPWITFDKDPKEEILTSSRSSVIDAPGLFANAPTAMPATVVSAPPVEPSNVVVATDIRPAEPSLFDTTHDEAHVPPVAHPKRIMVAVGATLGLAAMILATVFVLGAKKEHAPVVAASAAPAEATTTNVVTAPAPPAPRTPAPPTTAVEPKEKSGWAKLTIKGPAKSHRVYLDGKMLLGQGQRSFTIRCGEHTIAVGNKTDAKDVDVPCNAEYVVAK